AKQLLPSQIAALERYIDPELLNASNYLGGRLWEDFQEDFDEWTLDMLKECEKEVHHCLRDILARRGVPIPRGKDRRKLYLKLFDTLGEKELHTWTPEEIQAQIDHGGGFISNYRPPLPRISLLPISSDQEANVASDLDFQSRDTTLGLGKVQLPQNQLTRNTQTQGLERGPHASVNKDLNPKMEKENYKDKFNDLKLDEVHAGMEYIVQEILKKVVKDILAGQEIMKRGVIDRGSVIFVVKLGAGLLLILQMKER
ncbi:hypothetical protein GcM3_181038, partial [Golovinomyces cichoracearum]